MTNIQTPVTIYTNGNGCKWINDAEGEAVDFVTVADALNRTADREAKLATATKALDDAREVLAGWLTGVEYDESLKAYDIIDKALTAISGDTKGDDDGK